MNINRSENVQKTSESEDSGGRQDSRVPKKSGLGKSLLQNSTEDTKGKGLGRNIKIKIKSYDTKVLDETVKKISDTLRKIGLVFAGPIPLPVKRSFTTVLKSPHVHKDARQVFKMEERKRMIQIVESKTAIAALSEMRHSNPSISISVEFVNTGRKHE